MNYISIQSKQNHSRETPVIPIRSTIPSNFQISLSQPDLSRNFQQLFQDKLIPLAKNSSVISQKFTKLNDDFGQLICEIHALFKAIYTQGIVIDPDQRRLDRFERRLSTLQDRLDKDANLTQKQKKYALHEIDLTKHSIKEIRSLAKQIEHYHPFSIQLGESEAAFVDCYRSDRPGASLLAVDEALAKPLRDFYALRQQVFYLSDEETTDNRILALYKGEVEELDSIIEDWSETMILQTQEEIQELSSCLTQVEEEDQHLILRQLQALEDQLQSVKSLLRNLKIPDSFLKPSIQTAILEISKQQHEIHKILDKQETQELLAPLEYGSDEWQVLVQKRPQKQTGWLKSIVDTITQPEKWSPVTKDIFHTLFNGMLLFSHVKGIKTGRDNLYAATTDDSGEVPSKTEVARLPSHAITLSKASDLDAGLIQRIEDVSPRPCFLSPAFQTAKSLSLEQPYVKALEKLEKMSESLAKIHKQMSNFPLEDRKKLLPTISKLYQDVIKKAKEVPLSTASSIARADWLQAAEDLSHEKNVLDLKIAQKSIEIGDSKMAQILIKYGNVLDFIQVLHLEITKNPDKDFTIFLNEIGINIRDKSGDTLLQGAAYRGYAEIIRLLGTMPGIEPNINDKGYTALLLAVQKNHTKAVRALLDIPNLDPNIRDDHGYTSLITAQLMGHMEVANEIELSRKDTITKDIKSYKLLSHSWELRGIGEFNIKLEGFYPYFVSEFMSYTLNQFGQKYPGVIPETHLNMIIHALGNIKSFSAEQALKDFKKGLPVLVSSGSSSHSIQVLFFNSYMVICNKGNGSLRPIEAYKIDPTLLTEEMLTKINGFGILSLEAGFENFFGKTSTIFKSRNPGPFLKNLNAVKDEGLCQWLENLLHKTKIQIVGNCAWESLETAIYAIMAIQPKLEESILSSFLSYFKQDSLVNERWKVYDAFTSWEEYTKLETVIHFINRAAQRILASLVKEKFEVIETATLVKKMDQMLEKTRLIVAGFSEEHQKIYTKYQKIRELCRERASIEEEGTKDKLVKIQKLYEYCQMNEDCL